MPAALLVLALLATGPTASGQTVPIEGLEAEGQERWIEALRIYQQVLGPEPGRADLWIRVADIHARLGNTRETLAALEAAVRVKREDPELYAKLSRVYAAADQPKAALAAIQGALALSPDHAGYLKAAGELASWNEDYAAARAAYRRLLQIAPPDHATLLAIARVDAWEGKSDAAVKAYREYLSRVPTDGTAWLEAARAESWRGNDAGAFGLLQTYRARFGESGAYRRELASVLTRGRRPGRALTVLRPLLSSTASDYELNLIQALAYAEYGHGEKANRAYEAVRALAPERKETMDLKQQLRIAFGSVLQPSGTTYGDSDGLSSNRVPVSLSIALASSFKLQAGYEWQELFARIGSGLERADGRRGASLERVWAGAELRPWPRVTLRVQSGRQSSAVRQEWTYAAGSALRLGDEVRLEYDREHSLMTISPRAVSLGILRDVDRVRLAWIPTFSFAIDFDASREALSDDNQRWAGRVAPRFAVVRNQRLNLDAGATAYVFGADRNLGHGYYDPSRYEFYGLTLLPYFKFGDNAGLSVFLEAGAQKDQNQSRFEPGGSAAAELTLGIYRAWMLKLNGSATVNSRLESGAFRGYSGTAVVARRF